MASPSLPPGRGSLSLRWRLTLAMGFLATLVVLIGVLAPIALGRIRTELRGSVQAAGELSQLANEVAIKAQAARRFDQSYFLHLEDPVERYVFSSRWDSAVGELVLAIAAFADKADAPDDLRQAALWKAALEFYVAGFRDVTREVEAGELTTPRDASVRFSIHEQNIQTLSELTDEFAVQKRTAAEQAIQSLDRVGYIINVVVGSVSVVSILLAVGLCLYFPGRLTRPLTRLSEVAGRLAAGDLKARAGLRNRDELGALGSTFDQMATIIEQRTAAMEAQYRAAEAARCEAESARVQVSAQLATIEAQRSAIEEMSVPILPVAEGVLVMPLIGALDSTRIRQAQERALVALEGRRTSFLLVDITGVPVVDSRVAQGLIQIVQSTALLGARTVLVGIRPEVAQTVVGLGIDLDGIVTRATLQDGVHYAAEAAARRNGRVHHARPSG